VLDTIESLFAGLPNQLILRAELRRLFRWLKTKGVTAIITGERGEELLQDRDWKNMFQTVLFCSTIG
jgi:circadian clock protein KaiC